MKVARFECHSLRDVLLGPTEELIGLGCLADRIDSMTGF